MSKTQVKPVPDGMHTVTPHLVCAGAADAIEFYKKAFNAVELGRMAGPQGKLLHGAIRIGDSTIMLADEYPDMGYQGPASLGGSPVSLMIYVDDVDTVFNRAVEAGATVKEALADKFPGYTRVIDEEDFQRSGSSNTTDLGYRYMVMIGFRF